MVKGQVCIWTKWPSGRSLSRFQWHEVTGSISTPPWVRWQSIKELPPALNSPAAIYTPGWREALWEWSDLPKNTAQCPRPRLEPGPFNLEWSALTMRLLNLSQTLYSWLTAKAKYCFPMTQVNSGKWMPPKFLRLCTSRNQGHYPKFYTNSWQSLHSLHQDITTIRLLF